MGKDTKNFLSKKQHEGKLSSIDNELPKSIIVCEDHTYFTQLAVKTIVERSEKRFFETERRENR